MFWRTRTGSSLGLLGLLVVLGGCGGSGEQVGDASVGVPDGGAVVDDAGPGADGGGAADAGEDAGGSPDAGVVPDAGLALDGGGESFESCCAQQGGCTTTEAMELCSGYEPAFGRCSVSTVAGVCVDTTLCGGDWSPAPGFCPGPASIQCCRPPSGGTCTGTERPLPNTGIQPVSYDSRCPDGMKVIGEAFCIDVYEAFLVEDLPDGGVAEWSPFFNPGTRTMRAVSASGAVPQGYINANQAEEACNRAGKRLCSSTEWLRACRTTASWIYPYGNTRRDGWCNDARSIHPAIEYFGTSDPSVFSMIDHPCLNQLEDGLALTGSNAQCVTPEGIFDMMGNLHEWVSDASGTFRGGFYVDTRINGEGCLYATTAHNRLHWDYSTGFRCCAPLLPSP